MKNKKNILVSKWTLIFFILVGLTFSFTIVTRNVINNKSDKSSLDTSGISNSGKNKIWLQPDAKEIGEGDNFILNVYSDTDSSYLGVFSLELKFNSKLFLIDIDKGEQGFDKGVDGNNFMIMSNPHEVKNGSYRLSGICAQDCVRGKKKHVAIIYAKSLEDFELKDDSFELIVKELGDEMGKPLN